MRENEKYCSVCGEKLLPLVKSKSKIEPINALKDMSFNESYQDPKNKDLSKEIINNSSNFYNDFSNSNELANKSGFISKNQLMMGVAILSLVFFIIFIVNTSSKVTLVTVTVEMTIQGESCSNLSAGYADVPNGQVILMLDGKSVGFGTYSILGSSIGVGCQYTASIADVPSDGKNYSIAMANGNRGTIYNTRSELEANEWTFSLSLGEP